VQISRSRQFTSSTSEQRPQKVANHYTNTAYRCRSEAHLLQQWHLPQEVAEVEIAVVVAADFPEEAVIEEDSVAVEVEEEEEEVSHTSEIVMVSPRP
jgi:hypothetical protein